MRWKDRAGHYGDTWKAPMQRHFRWEKLLGWIRPLFHLLWQSTQTLQQAGTLLALSRGISLIDTSSTILPQILGSDCSWAGCEGHKGWEIICSSSSGVAESPSVRYRAVQDLVQNPHHIAVKFLPKPKWWGRPGMAEHTDELTLLLSSQSVNFCH